MDYIKTIIQHIWRSTYQGPVAKWVIGVWLFFGGIHLYIYSVFALTIMDVITGVMAAKKKGEPITSRKLRKGLLEKTALYLVLLLSVFVLDTLTKNLFAHAGFYFVFIVTFLISTYEITSILENLSTMHPQIPFLSGLVRIFKKMGDSTVNGLENKVDGLTNELIEKSGQDLTGKNPNPTSETQK
jgi:toxin secretion/phage lysis holin